MLALMAPSVVFVCFLFALPIVLFLFRAIDNAEIPEALPRTTAAIAEWREGELPPEPVYAALVSDLAALRGTPQLALLARRLNYAIPGFRGVVTRTGRLLPQSMPESPKAALIAIDATWADPAAWGVLRQQSGKVTDFYLLSALDLKRDPSGSVVDVDRDHAIFVDLYGRTLTVSIGVTLLCVAIGYPVAAVMAQATPAAANWLLMAILVPFWTSLLVRSTAWVILLQNEGLVNKTLIWLGAIDAPLALVFNRTGVYIAMVHVLLPYMILPLYSVMKGISPSHLRAAASLGASPVRVFFTVYLPLTMPGVAAGATLVFVSAVGFYVTPALVGGPRDQMIGYFIAYFTNSAVNWGLASALGAFLLVLVAATYLVLGKLVGFERLKVR
ncbi:MAG: ABC transporter permease [Telmatospirillum sp.]|nr:ABC transporter permease [Telmatospirillum sp.]